MDLMDAILREVQSSMEISLARVSSNKCPNVKSAFQNIAKQLIRSNPNVTCLINSQNYFS
jgi:hypothetical protein